MIGQPIASLPAWVQNWSQVAGMLTIRDANNDGILQLAELTLNQDIIVLATPEIAGLPYVISGLVAAGGLAAALSTADGLLLAIANALSHDIYYKMIDPQGVDVAAADRVARPAAAGGGRSRPTPRSTRPSGIIQMVAWAFSIAAAGLFAPLVLGIWWKRRTRSAPAAGMIAGFGICLFYLIGTRYFDMPLWWGINNVSCGIFGIPLAFLVTYVVSMMTAPPSKEMQDFIDSIRIPRGDVVVDRRTEGRIARRRRNWRRVRQRALRFFFSPAIVSPVNDFFWGYLPFWIWAYGLAVVAWTCLGRFMLGFMVPPNSGNYIWRAFRFLTDWAIALIRLITPALHRAALHAAGDDVLVLPDPVRVLPGVLPARPDAAGPGRLAMIPGHPPGRPVQRAALADPPPGAAARPAQHRRPAGPDRRVRAGRGCCRSSCRTRRR